MGIFAKGGKAFNCRQEPVEGVVYVKCEPLKKEKDIKEALGDRPVLFRLEQGGRVNMIDDGGVDQQTIKELQDYIKYLTD